MANIDANAVGQEHFKGDAQLVILLVSEWKISRGEKQLSDVKGKDMKIDIYLSPFSPR